MFTMILLGLPLSALEQTIASRALPTIVMDTFYRHSGGEGTFHEADESDADHSVS
ncbi:hypothetical protein ACWEJP_27315 [Streptomyces sp. NPDC004749]